MTPSLHWNKWFVWSLLWFAASVYALLLQPASQTPPPFPHFDKVGHAALFFAQFWLLAKGFFSQQRAIPWRLLLAAAIGWAALSETLQALCTTTRQGDVFDALADLIGTSAALYLAHRVQQARVHSSQG